MLPEAYPTAEIRKMLDVEQGLYSASGFGAASVPGHDVALVVDVPRGFVGHGDGKDRDRYPTWCGDDGPEHVARIAALVDEARRREIPIVYTTGSFSGLDGGYRRLSQKHPRAAKQPEDTYTVVPEIAPRPGELVLAKQAPSGFFGTPLIAILTSLGVDTIVVAGCSTSGCVRATVVDGFSFGLTVVVPSDAVFDRSSVGHEVTLFEVGQKYADVLTTAEVLEYFAGLEARSADG